ncbi:MAG: hypothetical protein QMC80_02110 [Thermoplasmatales archaeon]|nr:hypothetical protein [Thermoplasmatales archaeon]
MKEIKKELYLDEIRLSQVVNAPYKLILSPSDSHLEYENQKSSFIMGKETLGQCGINKISRDLLGSLFELTLKKIGYKGSTSD